MIRLTPYLTPEQARRRRRADLAWRAFMVLALILAAAWLLAPEASATPEPDEPGVCEGSPEVLGHEWQPQTRTRDLVPEVVEVSHQVYAYKKKVETFRTEHEYQKEVRGDVWQKDNGKKGQWHKTGQKFDWTWWTPASTKWSFNDVEVLESGAHNGVVKEWAEGNGNKLWRWVSTEYRYVKNGTTRQVPDGHTWEYSGEVTEPRDVPWVLLPGYPRTEVTTEHVPAYYTPWTDWADAGDVVRTDEHTEPETPADTDVIEHRWVYVGTYVRTEAVPPAWQDTDPEGECYTGPTPTPTPTPTEPPLECPDGKAPGWLDEDGEPTSCVDDDPRPTPTEPPAECETPSECDEGDRWPEPTPDPMPTIEPEPDTDDVTGDDHPDTDEPRDEPVDELAETGLDAGVLGVIAAVLVAAGGGLIFRNYRLTKE